MTLKQYQRLVRTTTSRHSSLQEREAAKEKLAWAEKHDPVSGTVYRPVAFGSGMPKGEMVDYIVGRTGCTKIEARRRIKAAATKVDGMTVYTDRLVAEAAGADCVGMGSCTSYRVAEGDPDAIGDADISEAAGDGWRLV